MRLKLITLLLLITAIVFSVVLSEKHWLNIHPKVVEETIEIEGLTDSLPEKNKAIVEYIENNGEQLAPDYKSVVCTEFLIKVLDNFVTLSKSEKNQIRIIVNDNLNDLINQKSPLIKGVQTALTDSRKGIAIENLEQVKPGDLVQFWNGFAGSNWGHCGIVRKVDIKRNKMTLYSSHPVTDGYGIQEFEIPGNVFFVRIN